MHRAGWLCALLLTPIVAGASGALGAVMEATSQEAEAKDHAADWPDLEDAVIRPGVKVLDGFCTAGFIFSSPDNRTLYLNIASHCVTAYKIGDPIPLGNGSVVGTLVYCSHGIIMGDEDGCTPPPSFTEAQWNDLALIRIPDSARHLVHPAILHWGGPTHLEDQPAVGTHILIYGNSRWRDQAPLLPADTGDAMEGYVIPYSVLGGKPSAWVTPYATVPSTFFADSGAPLMTASGGAFGIVKAPTGAVNLASALAYMEHHTDLIVELKTAALLHPGVLPELAG